MAFLRTTKILEEINLLFEEHDFELRSNKKLRKKNRYKIQPVVNINGTVTVVASYGNRNAVYITFYGNGIVDLWPRQETFLIDREKDTPEEIRKCFRNMLETKYKFEFKNGGHSALVGETTSDMLRHPRIIPQIFKVFREKDFKLLMCDCNIPTRSSWSNRLTGGILPDGRMFIKVGIENLVHEYSYANTKIVLFDGSDMVGICDLCDIKRLDNLSDTSKLHMVAIGDARQVLIEQHGVSFDEEWRMNKEPIFDIYGIPFDSSYYFTSEYRSTKGTAVDVEQESLPDENLLSGRLLAKAILDENILGAGFADCDDSDIDLLDLLFDREDED